MKKIRNVMKKFIATTMMFCACVLPASALDNSVELSIDGRNLCHLEETYKSDLWYSNPIDYDVYKGFNENGSAFVPLRIISEILGAEVSWESPNVTIKIDDDTLVMKVGSNVATKNGVAMSKMPASAKNIDGRVYVPLRFVAEAFGISVDYANRTVFLDTGVDLTFQGEPVKDVYQYTGMTMGGYTDLISSNAIADKYLKAIESSMTKEVPAPEHYTSNMVADYDKSYLEVYSYIAGELHADDNLMFDIYSLCTFDIDDGEYAILPEYLLKVGDKWYNCDDLIKVQETDGSMKICIYNSVV